MPADPLRFVLISYSCNFWGLAALRALLASAAECDTPVQVDLIHNGKSRTMIDHFRSCAARGPNATVTHITAYEGVFQQVENYAAFPGSEFNRHLRHHGFVWNWLIKYRLPRGRHYLLDHDAIADPPFVGWLSGIAGTLADKLFVFPHYDWKSLTAPMFSCDTSVRDWLSEFCDLGWTTGVVAYERARLGRCERFYTDRPLERHIRRDYFDDTLHNVVRFLLSRWPGLADRFALKRWEHLQHLSDPGTMPVDPRLVELVDRTIRGAFQAEYFRLDSHSIAYARFEKLLTKIGLLDRFQAKIARG